MIEEMKIRYNYGNGCEEIKCSEYCNNKKEKSCCLKIVIAILAILFVGVIGVIIGAALSATILGALAAVIVLAVVLFIMLILSIIIYFCIKNKNKKYYCYK